MAKKKVIKIQTNCPWTIVSKRFKAPMGRKVAGSKKHGYFRCVVFDPEAAVKFKTREDALICLDKIFFTYGAKIANKWKPRRWNKVEYNESLPGWKERIVKIEVEYV